MADIYGMYRCKISSKFIGPVFLAVWGLAVAAGMLSLAQYEMTPSKAQAAVARSWPSTVTVKPEAHRPTLIMVLHPRCPCSRASVSELSTLMAHLNGQLSAQILFVQPRGASLQWVKGDLWKEAAAIPGVTASVDVDGKDAAAFGAQTSGAVMLYDVDARLIFAGGITDGRGHEGDNAGCQAILSLLRHGHAATNHTPIYGCPLNAKTEQPCPGGHS